jgi:hypothetical protein
LRVTKVDNLVKELHRRHSCANCGNIFGMNLVHGDAP